MKTKNKMNRAIATFFLLIFFPTLLPSSLYAANNTPKSPEAASFEPVDATDMVNLITGQYSYVLPLLNVPSPEGGYPIALAYHAGIAMDQEASWAGLGWNLNPGAINRSVNGYPDDYNASPLNEYFWDNTVNNFKYTASVGYSAYGIASVGVGFNWGNNQAMGGYVSVGVGYMEGGNGMGANATVGFGNDAGYASIGVGITVSGGLSFGASIDTNGDMGGNVGFNNNGAGFSVGYNTNGTTSVGLDVGTGNDNTANLDISFSSRGVGISGGITNKTGKTGKNIDGGIGAGMFVSFNNSVSMGDYASESSGWTIPIVVPTPIGVFSLSFGKQEFKYWMGKNVNNFVTGPINFKNGITDVPVYSYASPNYVMHRSTASCTYPPQGTGYCQYNDINLHGPHGYGRIHMLLIGCNPNIVEPFAGPHTTYGGTYISSYSRGFMDINEVSFNQNSFSDDTDVVGNNMTFPSYDNYVVSGQGISGSMSPTLYKSGALFGLDGRENKELYALKYTVRNQNASGSDFTKFNNVPQFEFDNEVTSYLGVNPAQFNTNTANALALDYYNQGSIDLNDKPRRRTSNYIEYYTNDEIATNYTVLKNKGFLLPEASGFSRSSMPKSGIGAYKVTTVDGKTYHYSLPVYNHEIITRTNGVISQSPNEWQSYFEKRQLEPFATHWLLTAVTGPDYVDNGDGMAGDGDLGYWTSFEYGKWTDAFIWKNPYMKDKYIDESNPAIKTWIRGRKQLYYLDKIKTRTHTALFIKGQRVDSPSPAWGYDSAEHIDDRVNNSVVNRFTVPSQNQLRLEKIILVKNTNLTVNKTYSPDINQSLYIKYNQSIIKENEQAKYNCFDNVLDSQDNWQTAIPNALKVIDFNYDYSLVSGDNRLTLKSVNFKGKSGNNVLPPYKFEYLNDNQSFNIDNKDEWGYNINNSAFYSLSKITTPQGGKIEINYEKNKFISSVPHKIEFSTLNTNKYKVLDPPNMVLNNSLTNRSLIIQVNDLNNSIGIPIGQKVDINFYYKYDRSLIGYLYNGTGTVTQILSDGKYRVSFDNAITSYSKTICLFPFCSLKCEVPGNCEKTIVSFNMSENNFSSGGGCRVANLKVFDGLTSFITDYKYGQNENGIGRVSYVPFAKYVTKEVPYSAELPAPRVMYEYVTMSSHKEGVPANGKMRYNFNVMKAKDPNKIKFGDFYEIIKTDNPPIINTNNNKSVSVNSFTVKENFAALGQLLEVTTFNSQNQLLSKVYSNYHPINAIPNNMGITQESYQSYKEIDYTDNTSVRDKWVINSSTRIKYPSVVKSSTEQKGGYSYTTEFNDYDLVSGISKEQIYTSSDGKSFKTRSIPAYLKYAYSSMGSKVDNINNKNMLSQTTANYSYILDTPTNTWKETGVGITTWNNVWIYQNMEGVTSTPILDKEKIWRKHKSYSWNGVKDNQGIFTNYNATTDDGFDWTVGVGSQPAQWKQTSEVTLYNKYSMALEAKDINGNKAATKMGDSDSKIMTTGNAGYNEMYFTAAENIKPNIIWLEPEVKMNNASRSTTYFHTGKQSIATTATSEFGVLLKNGQHRSGKYKLSVWVEKTNAAKATLKVNGNVVPFVNDNIVAGNWVLKTAIVDVPLANCSVYLASADATTVYYDDLMLRPVASSMIGYVYNEFDELTHIIANNGLATCFEYDGAGRLIKTYVEIVDDAPNGLTGGFKLSSVNKINYKNLR